MIRKLDDRTINRIAAGEVIQRPSAAVKELIENSLDAGATSISLIVKEGGLSSLQIQDNGHGISKEDLFICCERFTTSKIESYTDLQTINTFGFRGEALASISHVARVTITSKTESSPCAYKAKYCDGKIIPCSGGQAAEPTPCAGVNGTILLVEDLFYNMPTRKAAFKNSSEEYHRLCDVVMKYSIHFSGVAFSCRKFNTTSLPDVQTNSSSTTLQNISNFYGAQLARELLELSMSINEPIDATIVDVNSIDVLASLDNSLDCNSGLSCAAVNTNSTLNFKLSGFVSNANYSVKKSSFILFINHRLVDSASLKRMIESLYLSLLPKHTYPFVYLDVVMPPENIDVNVHPTKREVHFLHEELFLQRVNVYLSGLLRGANDSRTFYAQSSIMDFSFSEPTPSLNFSEYDNTRKSDSCDNIESISQKILILPEDNNVTVVEDFKDLDNSLVDEADESQSELDESVSSSATSDDEVVSEIDESDADEIDEEPNFADVTLVNDCSFEEATPQAPASEVLKLMQLKRSYQETMPRVESRVSSGSDRQTPYRPSTMVRTDFRSTKIDSFFSPGVPSKSEPTVVVEDETESNLTDENAVYCQSCTVPAATCACCSVNDMRDARQSAEITSKKLRSNVVTLPDLATLPTATLRHYNRYINDAVDYGIMSIVKEHVFVGMVDNEHCLLQHGVRLLLVDLKFICVEFFKQIALRMMNNFDKVLTFEEPLSLGEILRLASESCDGGTKRSWESLLNNLILNREVLNITYAIDISEDGFVVSIPMLMNDLFPKPARLGEFLFNVAVHCDNKEIAPAIAYEIARVYAFSLFDGEFTRDKAEFVELSLLPNLRSHYVALSEISELYKKHKKKEMVISLASLDQMYKIFERC